MAFPVRTMVDADETPARRRGPRLALFLGLALLPAVLAIWVSPCFVTQDGPAHLYNAQVLRRSFDPGSPYRSTLHRPLATAAQLGGAPALRRARLGPATPGRRAGRGDLDPDRPRRGNRVAPVPRRWRARPDGLGGTRGPDRAERHLALRLHELPARGLDVRGHPGCLVGRPRAVNVGPRARPRRPGRRRLLLPPRESRADGPWPDRPRRAGAGRASASIRDDARRPHSLDPARPCLQGPDPGGRPDAARVGDPQGSILAPILARAIRLGRPDHDRREGLSAVRRGPVEA